MERLRAGTEILPIKEGPAFEKISPKAYSGFEIKTNPYIFYFKIFVCVMGYSVSYCYYSECCGVLGTVQNRFSEVLENKM